MAAKEALKKLEEQLNCSICLGIYTDPKLLQCNHVFCQMCLVKLVIRDQQGRLAITCPNCRQVTPVPVTGLQAAFHINQLLEIQDSVKNLREAPVSVEGAVGGGTSSLNPVRKGSYCSEHSEKELELYCETCGKLICCYCAIKGGTHHTHDHELLKKAYERYSKEIASSFEPMERQLNVVRNVLAQISTRCGEITSQQAVIKTDIHNTMKKLHDILHARETSLINQLHQITQAKLKALAAQKDQLETTQAQLSSCLEFMKESVKSGSCHEEVLMMKTTIAKQVRELTTTLQPNSYQPNTEANIVFSSLAGFSTACQNFGKLSIYNSPDPSAVYDSPSLIIAGLFAPWGIVTNNRGELIVSEESGHRISVFNRSGERLRSFGTRGCEQGQFDTPRGVAVDTWGNIIVIDCKNHRLQQFTAGGQFLASVGTHGSGPQQFKDPKDLVLNPKNGKLYVIDDNPRVQVLNSDLTFYGTFGTRGSGEGQFEYPCGIACDSTGKTYVADSGNDRIQVFTAEGEFLRVFGSSGAGRGELRLPIGIAVHNGRVYASEYTNHRVSVFLSEGQFVTTFGRDGGNLGEFKYLANLAIDNGLLYVCDRYNHRIQAFVL